MNLPTQFSPIYRVIKTLLSKNPSNGNAIPVCLAADNNYAEPLLVTVTSILVNAKRSDKLHFYILNGGISQENLKRLRLLKQIKYFDVTVIDVDEKKFETCPVNPHSHFKKSNYYRLRMASFIPNEDKIIYLDSDVLVLSSLKPLYNTDINDYYIAACIALTSETNKKRLQMADHLHYFNSGVMLINTRKWREENLEGVFFRHIAASPSERFLFVDQDVLNDVCAKNTRLISQRWNVETRLSPRPTKEYLVATQNPLIIHYLGQDKPWHKDTHLDTKLYKSYWEKMKELCG